MKNSYLRLEVRFLKEIAATDKIFKIVLTYFGSTYYG